MKIAFNLHIQATLARHVAGKGFVEFLAESKNFRIEPEEEMEIRT